MRLTADETITRAFAEPGGAAATAEPGGDAGLLGRTLGARYVIEAFLGQGGMGTVYAAFDAVAEHHVALKFIRPELAQTARAGARLRSELRTALAVTHPNVARTHTLEELDGHTFLVMERLDGPTLDERLARGPVPFAEALALARGIVAGVDAAHARGVVHRDLKPLNIKLVADERPVIMDFGLAVLHLEQAESRERTGNTIVGGTPGYMAPEVIAGEIGDRRADVYALGVMLHELFTGRRPVPGASTSLPAWLDRLLSDAVAANPEERPIHAGEVRWRLERGEGAPGARSRRSIGLIAGAALVAAAVSAGIVLALVRPGSATATVPASASVPATASVPASASGTVPVTGTETVTATGTGTGTATAPGTGTGMATVPANGTATVPVKTTATVPATAHAVGSPADAARPPVAAVPHPAAATTVKPGSPTNGSGARAAAPAGRQPTRAAPQSPPGSGTSPPPPDAASPPDAAPPPPPAPDAAPPPPAPAPPHRVDPDAPWDPTSAPRAPAAR